MFVLSVSKNKLKRSVAVAFVVVVLSFGLAFFIKCIGDMQNNNSDTNISLTISDEEDILQFISQYGWEVDKQPVEVRDVIIPEVFDEVYANYNEIQLEQGFDIQKYAGMKVKRWTYIVRNYPDISPEDDYIRINVLISDGAVIGGDVCSVKLNGFMHGFSV